MTPRPIEIATGEPFFSLTLDGEPVAWARAGKAGKVHYTPKRQKKAMERLQFYAKRAMGNRPPTSDGVILYAEFQFRIPASWPKWKRQAAAMGALPHTAHPDYDNCSKLLGDALNNIVFHDDRQISKAVITKAYGENPKTEIWIWAQEGPEIGKVVA